MTFNAKAEAERRRKENSNLNVDDQTEYAYSPAHNTVGMRNSPDQAFRIFNTAYPMYGHNEKVTDWISVGVVKSLPGGKTVHHPADTPIRYLCHFTPMHRASWCWMILKPAVSLSGLQRTIDGQIVDTGAGTTAWTGDSSYPSFATRQAGLDYCREHGIELSRIDPDPAAHESLPGQQTLFTK